jgi:plasmid stabilization system protein ParE
MQIYEVHITSQAHISLRDIVKHKIEYSEDIISAKNFADGFYDATNTLITLPHRGHNMPKNNRAIIYKNHLIIYHITEPNKVEILDIIDPRQYTVANRYY